MPFLLSIMRNDLVLVIASLLYSYNNLAWHLNNECTFCSCRSYILSKQFFWYPVLSGKLPISNEFCQFLTDIQQIYWQIFSSYLADFWIVGFVLYTPAGDQNLISYQVTQAGYFIWGKLFFILIHARHKSDECFGQVLLSTFPLTPPPKKNTRN